MTEKRLTSYRHRRFARAERDSQWAFMGRVAREEIVWVCPWDNYSRHKDGDGVYVFGLMGAEEFLSWLHSHKDWWEVGPWVEKRCARSIRITEAGRAALANREQYDMEPVHGGMVEPGWICTPLPPKKSEAKSPGCICDPKRREDQIRTNPYCKAKHA